MLPDAWQTVLADELKKPYWKTLQDFVAAERNEHEIYPPNDEVFTAFELTPPEKVRVLILGQDPYPNKGQGHGLSFSVKPGVAIPGSLRNMYKELNDDLGIPPAKTGYLVPWAKQGVMMLNAVLTVRAGEANSHKSQGWEVFTDTVIHALSEKTDPVIFVLWGAYAQKKTKLIDTTRHAVIQSAHPSPLSAKNGFFGSKPYSKINAQLTAWGQPEIDWRLG
ncbi:uracil-DNA glycosylase [Zavarzinella formosa]|uniref:uracil-DNA glycosylase n=1 Tax=Zavarzinella formosa TaxID=360055 RepID=UPI000316DE79|nr:uracil-DNA glycosylase [Zavarzinella formosa]